MKEFLEQSFAMTCTKNTMMHWMQTPFKSMQVVSIDELRKEPYLRYLRKVYSSSRSGERNADNGEGRVREVRVVIKAATAAQLKRKRHTVAQPVSNEHKMI